MPKMADIYIYNNDGSIFYGGDGFSDLAFDIGIQKDRLTGNFGEAQNGATLDGGTLILPVNILGLTTTPGKNTPDIGEAVGDTINVSGLVGNSFSFYIVPAETPTNPKGISLDNLTEFKAKCDETYASKSEIPAEYTLPIASANTLGGVQPVAKTSAMTQQVGVDSSGALYTEPSPPVDSNPTNGSDNPVSSGGVYTALSPLQQDMEQAKTDIEDLQDDVTALQNAVNASYYTTQDITAAYTTRTTAAGAQIVNRGLAMLKTVEGSSVSSQNLGAGYKESYGANNRITYDSATQTYSVNPGNTSLSEAAYTLSVPIPAGTEISIYVECDQGEFSGTFAIGGYHQNPNSWQLQFDFPKNQDLSGKSFTKTAITTDTVTDFWLFVYGDVNVITPIKFRVMFNIGAPSNKYIPYYTGLKSSYFQSLQSSDGASESDSIALPSATELPAYNSISFENGQNITGGQTITFTGTETWTAQSGGFVYTLPSAAVASSVVVGLPYLKGNGTISNLSDGQVNNDSSTLYLQDNSCADVSALQQKLALLSSAGTPFVVRYQLATPTTSAISVSPYYRAWNGGTETVQYGSVDNSSYGAVNTLTQNYVEKGGIDL